MRIRIWLVPLLLGVFLAVSSVVSSQNRSLDLSGTVWDSVTSRPLPLVHLYLEKAKTGVATDPAGKYTLTVPVLPDRLTVSCIGYVTFELELTAGTAPEMDILLVPKVEMLDEVTIQSLKVQPVFKDENWSVLDYELQGNSIYLLIYRNRLSRSELLLLTNGGDTLARQTRLPDGITGLLKDCIDTVHLLTRELAYEINRKDGELAIRYPIGIDSFNLVFGNCITSVNNLIIFRRYYHYGLGVGYLGVNLHTRGWKKIAYVEDPFKMNLLAKNPTDLAALRMAPHMDETIRYLTGDEAGIPDQESYAAMRNVFPMFRFTQQAFYSPLKAPLVRIDGNLAVFDFPGSMIRYYDGNGTLFYQVPITFHHINIDRNIFNGVFDTKPWAEFDILSDEICFKVYALSQTGALTVLKKINLFNGSVTGTTTLAYPYPDKVRINNGYAYFMYKPPGDWMNKRLYRQRIN